MHSWGCDCYGQRFLRQIEYEAAACQIFFVAVGVGLGPEAADVDGTVGFWFLDHFLRSAALLVDVGFDHLSGQVGRQAAVFAALEQDADHDVGIAAGSEADKPSVLREVFGVFEFRACGQ